MSTTKPSEMAFMELAARDTSKDKAPKAGWAQIDFTGGVTPQILDFQYPEQKGLLLGVLGLFIDNADNSVPLTIRMSGTQQRIVIPSACQALLPLLSKSPEQISFDSVGSTAVVFVQALNFRPEPMVWGARAGGLSPTAPTYVRDITNNNMTWGNVALGADQVIIPANASGQMAIIKAPSANVNTAWLNWNAAAALNTYIPLDPGESIVIGEPGNYEPRAVHVFGTAPDRIAFGYV